MAAVPISLVVLTHNEERNIQACLASAAGFDDVHVLDSYSTDRTVELAAACGASVSQHEFRGFGSQRNHAIDHLPTRYPWQLHLDADERLTAAGIAEMVAAVNTQPEIGGYRMANKIILGGKWIRHVTSYPVYQVRLFHKERLRFEDHGHGQREITRWPLGTLREPYLHLAFSHGLDAWFIKHVGYARREAEESMKGRRSAGDSAWSRDGVKRRRALKRWASRLPARWLLRFLHLAVLKGGFLDGRQGLTYAHMVATYEAMVEVYQRALRDGTFDDPSPPPA